MTRRTFFNFPAITSKGMPEGLVALVDLAKPLILPPELLNESQPMLAQEKLLSHCARERLLGAFRVAGYAT